jgi:bacteriophage N4 adsorption protein B
MALCLISAGFDFRGFGWPCVLGILAGLLLVSGLDDLVPVVICAWHHLRGKRTAPSSENISPAEERRIAIFVPCWKEAGVIGNMVRHNLASIRYRNFDFFIGVYPNDEKTVDATRELESTLRNVHVALCPHPGPTSKADCLNWIYQKMLVCERERHAFFDTVVLHDAEDLIYPEALAVINKERAAHAMVQVPVLPLSAGFGDFTHGIYCDEFAEFQTIDMPARQYSRSFVPSNGVGTGFAREIFTRLENERGSQLFDPTSLTEDYEMGVYIHRSGFSQLFVPLHLEASGFVATREYFPRTIRSAIRQRTRWVTGIALQGWERDGWRGSWRVRYWFWRDRKGLIANPLSLLTNLVFLAGMADWLKAAVLHRPWAFGVSNPTVVTLCWITLVLQCVRLIFRSLCVARIFGFAFATGVPLRAFHANFVNCSASLAAMWRFATARVLRRPLVWLKTEHSYPARESLGIHRRDLADVLVSAGFLSADKLSLVQAQMLPETDLADYLLASGLVSDEDICHAISLHSGLPATRIDTTRIKTRVARSLPAHVQKRFGIVPFQVQAGRLMVAGTRAPSSSILEELKNFTRLPIEFQIIPQSNYEELRDQL